MENASRAFLDAVRKSMRQIRTAIGAATISPSLLTSAERIQYQRVLRREENNAAVLGFAKDGLSIREIARRTGPNRRAPFFLYRSRMKAFTTFCSPLSYLRGFHGRNGAPPPQAEAAGSGRAR